MRWVGKAGRGKTEQVWGEEDVERRRWRRSHWSVVVVVVESFVKEASVLEEKLHPSLFAIAERF